MNKMFQRALLPLLLPFSLAALTTAQTAVERSANSLEEVYGRVHNSVVTIHTKGKTGLVNEKGQAATSQGVGSGVLVSKDGHILTAAHVVQTADTVAVEFAGGEKIPARILGSSPIADVALIQLEKPAPAGAVIAKLGDSDTVQVANQVFVVGAPLGISHTLTVGHISALRTSSPIGGLEKIKVFQTDASINKGNSGGPLFNMQGEVIGIVSYIVSSSGGSEGLGFAISSNTARGILLDRNPIWSGMSHLVLAGPLSETFNLPRGRIGLLVQQVAEGSPAARLGLRGGTIPAMIASQPLLLGGDIIVEAFDVPLRSVEELDKALKKVGSIAPGQTIRLKILRAGEIRELSEKSEVLMPWLLSGEH